MDLQLAGHHYFIPGGRGALGAQVAVALREAGAHVAISSRELAKAEEKAAEINAEGEGPPVLAVELDATDQRSLTSARTKLVDAWSGKLAGILNCTGGNHPSDGVPAGKSPYELSPEAVRKLTESNVVSIVATNEVFGPLLLEQPWSSVVNLGSMAGLRPLPCVIGYSAAKAALHSYTQNTAAMLAMHTGGTKHRINAIAFGYAIGDQNRDKLIKPDGGWTDRGWAIASMHPAGEWGVPDDIVPTALYLLSPLSEAVTGQVWAVDRGVSAMSLPRYGDLMVKRG